MYGQIALNLGRTEGVDTRFRSAPAGFRDIGDRWGMSFALMSQAEIHGWRGERGEHRQAVELYEEARGLLVELGAGEDGPWVHSRLASRLWLLGRRDRARELVGEASRIAERTGSVEGRAMVQAQLGEFARREGDHAEARRRMRRAFTPATEMGRTPHQMRAVIMFGLGLVEAADGDAGGP